MKATGGDRGVRKTKKALRESLALLLESKDIGDISVKELTETADVNRGTFYYHYKDIHDLYRDIEQELLGEIDVLIRDYMLVERGSRFEDFFRVLLQYVTENTLLIRMLLGNSGRTRFFTDEVRRKLMGEWNLSGMVGKVDAGTDPKEVAYYTHFIISGYLEVVALWLETGMQEPPDQMANLLNRIGQVSQQYFGAEKQKD